MKSRIVLAGLLAVAFLIPAQVAHAQNLPVPIFLKSKGGTPTSSGIAQETTQGIRLSGAATITPADDIDDIDYSPLITMASIRIIYTAAVTAEKDAVKATDRAKRDENLYNAIAKYQEALKQLPEDHYATRRHAEFKIGYLTGVLGLGSDKQVNRLDAIKKLKEFPKNHKDAWQLTPTLLMLIKLHADSGNFDEAKAAAAELANAMVPARAKQDGKMLVARLMMDNARDLLSQKSPSDEQKKEAATKFSEAQKELQDLLAALPADSPLKLHALLGVAQCKASNQDDKIKKEATQDLEKMLKETTDKELRPVVYNTLGELYYNEGKFQDARWQFLWVDVIYNTDKEEHAKALYYLWKVFTNLNEPERGQEFFEALSAPRFLGTAFREKALKENKQ